MASTQSYKDFLLELDKYRNKIIYARITSLKFDETPRESIEGRVTQGSINLDGASALRRSCSLTIVAQNFAYDDYLWGMNTKFKLEIGVQNVINPRYPDIIWFNQGIYLIASFNTSRSANNFTITIQGKDKMCLLNGEIGGSLTASVDFGQIEEEDEYGNWVIKKIPIPEIIRNAVHTYANEPYHNIIINDLETYGLELLEYRYDIPMYLYRFADPNNADGLPTNTYIGALLETSDKKYYLTQSGNPIALGDIPVDHLDMLVDTLVGTSDPKPVYVKENNKFIPLYIAKVQYGQTAGYRQTDLTYPGDLIANIGESVTSVLDKIKNMLAEFEYFYDVNGQFIFQKKQSFISTMWGPSTLVLNSEIEIMRKAIDSLHEDMTEEEYTAYKQQSEIAWGEWDDKLKLYIITYPVFRSYSYDEQVEYLWGLLDTYEALVYTSEVGNQPIEQLAIASSTAYTFNGGELITSFNCNPQINNLKNDYSVWGERTAVSGAKIPVHLRYAIDEKPGYYKAFDGKVYMTDRSVIEDLKRQAKEDIKDAFYDKVNSFQILYPIPSALPAPKRQEDGSWSPGWWDIRDWCNYYSILNNNEFPEYTMKWYSRNDLDGCVPALSLPISYSNSINANNYVWLLILRPDGYYNAQHGTGNPAAGSSMRTLYRSYYTDETQTTYKTEKVLDENGQPVQKAFIPPYRDCSDTHTYIDFLENDVKKQGNTVYFYNPSFPAYDSYEDLVSDRIEQEFEEYERLGLLNYVDWREIIYQMARDYYKHNTEDTFEQNVALNNAPYYSTGRTGYESYYIDIQGFWRQLYYPHLGDDYTALGVEDENGNFISGELQSLSAEVQALTEYLYGKEVDYSDNNVGGMENDICGLNNLLTDEKWSDAQTTVNTWYNSNKYPIDARDSSGVNDPSLYLTMLQDLFFRKKNELEVLTMTYDDKKEKYDKLKQDYTVNYYTQLSDSDARKHWHKNVFEAPETLNFWFDFLEATEDSVLGRYSVKNIGARTKPVNDTNIKSIYFRETPGVVFVENINETSGGTGYRYIQIPNIDTMFSISAQGKSAKERLDELLYQHSYSVESATVTTIPIYYLQPNTRVYLYDEATRLSGDYIVSKVTIPLSYNGTMQLTTTKAAENII